MGKICLTDVYCHDTLTVLEQLVQLKTGGVPMMAFSMVFLAGGALLLAVIVLVVVLASR
jgi:hypothetical protein